MFEFIVCMLAELYLAPAGSRCSDSIMEVAGAPDHFALKDDGK